MRSFRCLDRSPPFPRVPKVRTRYLCTRWRWHDGLHRHRHTGTEWTDDGEVVTYPAA